MSDARDYGARAVGRQAAESLFIRFVPASLIFATTISQFREDFV
jgi:hypothetical protein